MGDDVGRPGIPKGMLPFPDGDCIVETNQAIEQILKRVVKECEIANKPK